MVRNSGGAVLGVQAADVLPEVGAALRIEPRGRLVEEQQPWHVDEPHGDVEPPPLATGQGADDPALGAREVEPLHELGGAPVGLGGRDAVEPRLHDELLADQAVGARAAALPDVADLAADPGRVGGEIVARDRGAARRGRSRVVSMRSVVVLPAPLGPRKPTSSPGATSMSTPATATTAPRRVRNVRASPRASITGRR